MPRGSLLFLILYQPFLILYLSFPIICKKHSIYFPSCKLHNECIVIHFINFERLHFKIIHILNQSFYTQVYYKAPHFFLSSHIYVAYVIFFISSSILFFDSFNFLFKLHVCVSISIIFHIL